MVDPSSGKEPSTLRGAITYVATSLCLAAAWHAQFGDGLWLVNTVAGVLGIGLASWTLAGRPWRVLGWSWGNLLWGIALGAAMVLTTQLAARLLLSHLPPVLDETRRLYSVLETSPVSTRAPIVWLVVLAEELVYRGVVTSWCARQSTKHALLCSTALYVLPLTASGSWLLLAIGITVGALWTAVRLRSGGILVTLVSHGMWSCATFVAFPLV